MAIRNYVGARYVPKFADPVEWKPNTNYEAMEIVTYNGASYTSKIPVPPATGNPAENPNYWVLTGNYNAQVEAYRQETKAVSEKQASTDNDLATEISNRKQADTNLQNNINGNDKIWITGTNMACFGDSWMAGSALTSGNNRFPYQVGHMLNNKVFNFGVGGAGFMIGSNADNTIINQFKPVPAQMTEEEINKTHLVLIVGGCNDQLYSVNQLPSASEFATSVRNTVYTAHNTFPNALIAIALMTADRRGVSIPWKYRENQAIKEIKVLNSGFELKFLTDPAGPLYTSPKLWSPDNIHPNPSGAKYFAAILTNWLLGGSTTYLNELSTVDNNMIANIYDITNVDWGSGSIINHNGMISLLPFNAKLSAVPDNTDSKWVKVGTLPDVCYSKPCYSLTAELFDSDQNEFGFFLIQAETGDIFLRGANIRANTNFYLQSTISWPVGAYKLTDILN